MGGPAVVEVMEQLGFVQGKIHVIAPAEDVAVKGPVVGFELLASAEQAELLCSYKHQEPWNAPWISLVWAFSFTSTGTRR